MQQSNSRFSGYVASSSLDHRRVSVAKISIRINVPNLPDAIRFSSDTRPPSLDVTRMEFRL
jgi:hypothetical protein